MSDLHHDPTTTTAALRTVAQAKEQRRVIAGTIVGTSIEWYDFFLYASAAGLVFGKLFFGPMGPQAALVVSFLSVGLSFLFRPFGAFLAGHLGDRWGRKRVLMITLIGMGAATTLIGVLPTHSSIGVLAPILLILLRILQGISAGGEWGGAALMAVEHAPVDRRGIYGSAPQVGVPLGLLMSSGILALMTTIAPGEAFMAWGWRIPFLLSVVLIGVGYWIRHGVEESPVFQQIAQVKDERKAPIGLLFRKHGVLVIFAALIFAGNNAAGYMTTGGFIQSYATNPEGPLGFDRGPVLLAVTGSAVTWLIFTIVGGWFSDKVGRRTSYLVGWVVLFLGILTLFPLVNSGSLGMLFLGLVILTIGLGLTYGQQSATYTELFPASVRFSGVSISYAIGAILGGAFAPMIAQSLLNATGSTASIGVYLCGIVVLGFLSNLLLRDRTGIPLGHGNEEAQSVSPLVFAGRKDS
ncbi:MFS transporter [Kocuria sp. HSID16901]|uniref:MFS transporter n=1 Tax=Kocuria sp. HSID16901 TaxID=2419505 RepID=UPI00066129FE|nr:MFS transporter [Kocuria sp. HSID16901]MCT1367003.1 MHS family MFS transporter [Rothia sp. p3-SID1597]RUQ19894.1 MFS transporter [Kocuria sp. HSID16901]